MFSAQVGCCKSDLPRKPPFLDLKAQINGNFYPLKEKIEKYLRENTYKRFAGCWLK